MAAVVARLTYTALTRSGPQQAVGETVVVPGEPAEKWLRYNFRGRQVTLLAGPAVATGLCVAVATAPGLPHRLRAAAVTAAIGAGAFGAYDDVSGSAGARGFTGHLRALRQGEVTTGAVKSAGIGVTGLAAAALLRHRATGVDIVLDGLLIAGSANVLNLFDLRPGRAAKVVLLAGPPALADAEAAAVAGPLLGSAVALLPEEFGERAMLGDAGANALGAVLGVTAAARLSRRARMGAVATIAVLTAASERVSLSRLIRATPPLRRLDELGRRPE
ncbi:hypothetical protein [Salinactinospora qingdaonensis]|uniref:hypothetical protein n=1 Tax=Salinactinospora qingdaonensis TaxID=702744 RepID=UPI0031E710FC